MANSMMRKRILILGNSYLVVFKFRRELVERLVADGHDVWTCFPNGPFGEGEKSAVECGCHFIENHMERRGTNPLKDLAVIREYFSIIKNVKPDVVLTYTVKPDVYGGIACRLLKIPFIPNITGLGKGLDEGGLVQKVTIQMYKSAVKRAKCVFFQNESDKAFFDTNGIGYPKGRILPGSGVNLDSFHVLPYPDRKDPVRFIYVARLMKAKGIEQYLDAAHILKQKYPEVEFHICGYCEEDYEERVKQQDELGEVKYFGLVDDVRKYEADCHCVVLPSFHPEGICNVLLEGAACGRPLITTDHVGCRETVVDGETGFVVKQRDSEDLIEKMEAFIQLPYDTKVSMGLAGRKKVEKEFDRQIVVESYLEEINEKRQRE